MEIFRVVNSKTYWLSPGKYYNTKKAIQATHRLSSTDQPSFSWWIWLPNHTGNFDHLASGHTWFVSALNPLKLHLYRCTTATTSSKIQNKVYWTINLDSFSAKLLYNEQTLWIQYFLRCFLKVSADDYNQNTNKIVLKSRIGHSVFFVTAI